MAIATKTVKEFGEPDTSKEREQAGYEAERTAKKIQKFYGAPGEQVITSTPWQRAQAESPAATAKYEAQKQFVPQAYSQAAQAEQAGAQIQDANADFWDKYTLRADELARKQYQTGATVGQELQEQMFRLGEKNRELDFTAFRNQAERNDALEEAYHTADFEKMMTEAAINHKITMQDLDTFWKLQMNELQQKWLDYENQAKIDLGEFKAAVDTQAKLWGSLFSNMVDVAEYGDEKGWFE